jgi:hypothetical protein
MTQDEIDIMREHMVWLGNQLDKEREQSRSKTMVLKRMLDPEDLGFAVSDEVRKIAYQIISNETYKSRHND